MYKPLNTKSSINKKCRCSGPCIPSCKTVKSSINSGKTNINKKPSLLSQSTFSGLSRKKVDKATSSIKVIKAKQFNKTTTTLNMSDFPPHVTPLGDDDETPIASSDEDPDNVLPKPPRKNVNVALISYLGVYTDETFQLLEPNDIGKSLIDPLRDHIPEPGLNHILRFWDYMFRARPMFGEETMTEFNKFLERVFNYGSSSLYANNFSSIHFSDAKYKYLVLLAPFYFTYMYPDDFMVAIEYGNPTYSNMKFQFIRSLCFKHDPLILPCQGKRLMRCNLDDIKLGTINPFESDQTFQSFSIPHLQKVIKDKVNENIEAKETEDDHEKHNENNGTQKLKTRLTTIKSMRTFDSSFDRKLPPTNKLTDKSSIYPTLQGVETPSECQQPTTFCGWERPKELSESFFKSLEIGYLWACYRMDWDRTPDEHKAYIISDVLHKLSLVRTDANNCNSFAVMKARFILGMDDNNKTTQISPEFMEEFYKKLQKLWQEMETRFVYLSDNIKQHSQIMDANPATVGPRLNSGLPARQANPITNDPQATMGQKASSSSQKLPNPPAKLTPIGALPTMLAPPSGSGAFNLGLPSLPSAPKSNPFSNPCNPSLGTFSNSKADDAMEEWEKKLMAKMKKQQL